MRVLKFDFRVNARDLMVLSLANIYTAMPGIINIVFTVSMMLVTYRFWAVAAMPYRILLIIGILLFPFFQPMAIYLRSRNIVGRMPENMLMSLDDKGLTVRAGNDSTVLPFENIKSIRRTAGLVVIQAMSNQSYILNDLIEESTRRQVVEIVSGRMSAR